MKMIKLLSVAAFGLASLLLTSCGCCTGEEPVPPIRPIPVMQELPGAPTEIPILNEK